MNRTLRMWVAAAAACLLQMAHAAGPDLAALRQQVGDAERAFAKTMADRDHEAFSRFVSEEAVFFSGPSPLHGRQAVADYWKRFYEKPQAPFSWEPDKVEVLASGTLALTTGPVHDPAGQLIGRFNSIWRQEAPGVWRVVFDKGEAVCDCTAKP
jgi:ketosteroid isomerase-like protein